MIFLKEGDLAVTETKTYTERTTLYLEYLSGALVFEKSLNNFLYNYME